MGDAPREVNGVADVKHAHGWDATSGAHLGRQLAERRINEDAASVVRPHLDPGVVHGRRFPCRA